MQSRLPHNKFPYAEFSDEWKETMLFAQRLLDSRIDTIGDAAKPKSLVETFWLDKLMEIVEKHYGKA